MVSWVSVGKSAFFPLSTHPSSSSGLQGLFISTTCKPFSFVQIFPQNDLLSCLYIQITQPSILSGLGCTVTASSVIISQISCALVSFPGGSLTIKVLYLE